MRFEEWHKRATLEEKEERSLWFIEMAIKTVQRKYGDRTKIVVSCSFGIDSIVTLHLVKRVTDKLGLTFETVWNDTLNEYPQTRKYAKEITEAWGLNLIQAKPETTIRKVYEENGVDTLFKRKGDRTGDTPVVEKCCGALKHRPMKKAIKEHGWHLMFNGVRAGESRQRWMSGRRDADLYYSASEWKLFTARPILWWTALTDSFNYGNDKQEDVWGYVRKHDIPYNEIYDLNCVIDERYDGDSFIIGRETAEKLTAEGIKVFMPRTGCMACPIPIKRGYLRYLREVMPKVYRSMLFQLGFARVLVAEMKEEDRQALLDELNTFGIIDEKTQEAVIEKLEQVLEMKPCVFDQVGLDKRKH
jgi:3'-phosphoadenosine 5'-phosphosulfate sulfotransferase (PAPS reductase)/FAD synthetase